MSQKTMTKLEGLADLTAALVQAIAAAKATGLDASEVVGVLSQLTTMLETE